MPQSRNRPGHPFQKPSAIPASQRVKGRVIWAILFAIFGFAIVYFASEGGWVLMLAGTIAGAVIGYIAGKSMERDSKT